MTAPKMTVAEAIEMLKMSLTDGHHIWIEGDPCFKALEALEEALPSSQPMKDSDTEIGAGEPSGPTSCIPSSLHRGAEQRGADGAPTPRTSFTNDSAKASEADSALKGLQEKVEMLVKELKGHEREVNGQILGIAGKSITEEGLAYMERNNPDSWTLKTIRSLESILTEIDAIRTAEKKVGN